LEYLLKKINGETSAEEERVIKAKDELSESLQDIFKQLHWKEFELLTDLIFREAGLLRVSEVGKQQKDIDLELHSPITDQKIFVQVKSEAGQDDYDDFVKAAEKHKECQHFFVVHDPLENLKNATPNPMVKIWNVEEIARLVVNYGLVDWLIAKAR
jgi:hypothetical protein